MIAKHWQEIRDEGLANLNEKGVFLSESEDLSDTGDWKQFTLFQQGLYQIKQHQTFYC
jgi:aspartate beta-hydroxylase